MAHGIAQKEELDPFEIKQKLVDNVNKLTPANLKYLEIQMDNLIHKSIQDDEEIDDKNVEKDFISFLIKLYY